jgi:hypothetical protein
VLFTDDHESIPFVFGILRTKAGTATYTVRRALNGGGCTRSTLSRLPVGVRSTLGPINLPEWSRVVHRSSDGVTHDGE